MPDPNLFFYTLIVVAYGIARLRAASGIPPSSGSLRTQLFAGAPDQPDMGFLPTNGNPPLLSPVLSPAPQANLVLGSHHHNGLHTMRIVAIVIGSVALAGCVLILLRFVWKSLKKRDRGTYTPHFAESPIGWGPSYPPDPSPNDPVLPYAHNTQVLGRVPGDAVNERNGPPSQ